MDRVGGESVSYLVTPCKEEVVIDLSLDCLVVLFEEVAVGYKFILNNLQNRFLTIFLMSHNSLVNNAVKQLQSCIQRGQAPHEAWNGRNLNKINLKHGKIIAIQL